MLNRKGFQNSESLEKLAKQNTVINQNKVEK